jgi:hypothetical protein
VGISIEKTMASGAGRSDTPRDSLARDDLRTNMQQSETPRLVSPLNTVASYENIQVPAAGGEYYAPNHYNSTSPSSNSHPYLPAPSYSSEHTYPSSFYQQSQGHPPRHDYPTYRNRHNSYHQQPQQGHPPSHNYHDHVPGFRYHTQQHFVPIPSEQQEFFSGVGRRHPISAPHSTNAEIRSNRHAHIISPVNTTESTHHIADASNHSSPISESTAGVNAAVSFLSKESVSTYLPKLTDLKWTTAGQEVARSSVGKKVRPVESLLHHICGGNANVRAQVISNMQKRRAQQTSSTELTEAESSIDDVLVAEASSSLDTICGGDEQAIVRILTAVLQPIGHTVKAIGTHSVAERVLKGIQEIILHSNHQSGGRKTTEVGQFMQSILVAACFNFVRDEGMSVRQLQPSFPGVSRRLIVRAFAQGKQMIDLKEPFKFIKAKKRKDANWPLIMNWLRTFGSGFCHSDDYSRVDSFGYKIKVHVPVIEEMDGGGFQVIKYKVEDHPRRMWDGVVTVDDAFKACIHSDEWAALLAAHPSISLSKTMFARCRCPCVKEATPQSCVNVKKRQQVFYQKAIRKFVMQRDTTFNDCGCTFHQKKPVEPPEGRRLVEPP